MSATCLTPPHTQRSSTLRYHHLFHSKFPSHLCVHLKFPNPSSPLLIPSNSLKTQYQNRKKPFLRVPSYLVLLKPYLLDQRKNVLLGYLFSSISVFSLSKIVPLMGNITTDLSKLDILRLRNEGFVLGALVLARVVSSYLQQAFLWDAALSAVYQIRVNVYGGVLERDLGFFEGRDRDGIKSGDIAHRIASEAEDVAGTIYAALDTVVPSTLQLVTLSMQMVAISPGLSVISAAAIPPMALMVAFLGERLRQISKRAKISTAAMSAYLNEVLPAILFVKANNVELCEMTRFKKLAYIDRSERLRKRKMKALIPQVIQGACIGAPIDVWRIWNDAFPPLVYCARSTLDVRDIQRN